VEELANLGLVFAHGGLPLVLRVRAAPRRQMILASRSVAISPAEEPSSVSTSSVCSPSSGERLTSVMLSESLIGLPTVRYLPRVGWSTSTTVPVLRSDGSPASSFLDRIGPR